MRPGMIVNWLKRYRNWVNGIGWWKFEGGVEEWVGVEANN